MDLSSVPSPPHVPSYPTFKFLLLSCCMIKSEEEAVEEADDWSDTIPSSASVSHGLDSARSASASVMRLEVGGGATTILKNGCDSFIIRRYDHTYSYY